ncbi:putative nuclease HARBI1 [Dermacentor albipictus]|uniref:putative nuclease HARBI1 n=1 Tax=Dermacentor albipictus TaxID=60249 RepID=UPI0031FE0990
MEGSLRKGTVRLLCEELAGELEAERATGLSVELKVLCALRFFASGSFQSSIGSEETIRVSQSTTAEEKAVVNEGFFWRGAIPGFTGCIDGSLIVIITPKGERKAAFMCRKGYYTLSCMFICDADMEILAVDPLRPGSDHEAFV